MSSTNANERSSRLGAKLFDYGKVTLDYKKGRFYFKPYKNAIKDKLSQKPLAMEPTIENNEVVVGLIWDKNLKSKINVGDEILKIGDIDFQSMSFCEMVLQPKKYKSENYIDVKLKDVKTGKIKEIKISRIK